jgi:solute carrier family 39 (zinc transporter), member 1/2/3
MDSASEFKYAAAILVLFAGIGGTLFARELMSWRSSVAVTRLANSFAGGVFLGAALLHMLPDAQENFTNAFHGMRYPHFMLFGGIAFLFILLIDKVVTFPRFSDTSEGRRNGGGAAYPYFLAVLLSVHSVITGVALGLEQTLVGALAILVAVLAHKSIAAMALSISVEREKIDEHRSRILLWTFHATTPSGIVLGTLWSGQLEGATGIVVEAIFDAAAGGSFLYISVVDILVQEFSGSYLGWLFLSAASGFAIMATLALWA